MRVSGLGVLRFRVAQSYQNLKLKSEAAGSPKLNPSRLPFAREEPPKTEEQLKLEVAL